MNFAYLFLSAHYIVLSLRLHNGCRIRQETGKGKGSEKQNVISYIVSEIIKINEFTEVECCLNTNNYERICILRSK